ncbi:MAG TPA: hypothetical protein VF541_11345 [Longimicrobium sp.]|jgi:hypothetical protein
MERKDLLTTKLLVDHQNPRLPEVQGSQREAMRTMATTQGPKILALAEHIVTKGLNLGDLPIVMPLAPDEDRYVVLDGNRRLTALRALETPDLVAGVLNRGAIQKLKRLSNEYHKNPVESLLCVVAADRTEADPWIQLRHRGESGGAGLVRWEGPQGARYDARSGKATPHLDVLGFVKETARLPGDVLGKLSTFPVSTLERLINDPDVRAKLGIDVKQGVIYTRYPGVEVAKGLGRVVTDLARGKKTVTDVKRKDDRIRYVGSFGVDELPDPATVGPLRPLLDETGSAPSEKKSKTKGKPPKPKERATLVPRDCRLVIPESRIEGVFLELQSLHPDTFRNVAAVMLRVFVEWTIEAYIDSHQLRGQLTDKQNRSLQKRFVFVLDHMEKSGLMTRSALKPIRVELNNEHSLVSIDTLHAYVHDLKFHPKASELLVTWDRLEPVIAKIWS